MATGCEGGERMRVYDCLRRVGIALLGLLRFFGVGEGCACFVAEEKRWGDLALCFEGFWGAGTTRLSVTGCAGGVRVVVCAEQGDERDVLADLWRGGGVERYVEEELAERGVG